MTNTLKPRKKAERKMELQTFPKEENKTAMIGKLFRVLVLVMLLVIIAILLDATEILAQAYALEYGRAPESILQGAVDYIRARMAS